MSNPCIECGKERVDGKTWKERSGSAVITYTQTICPDPECQEKVEKWIEERKEKSALLIKKKFEAKLARQKQPTVN